MKRIFFAIQILCLLVCTAQCKRNIYTCDVDTSKTGYELAGAYDNCTVWNAQKTMTHIEFKDIDIRATQLPLLEFAGSYAALNATENWIQPFYTITLENMSAYPNAPASINGVILAKLKSKDSVDAAFGSSCLLPQGICADVQEDIYNTVLYDVLTWEQRAKYRSEGKRLLFIPDDAPPPLDNTTNPVNQGQFWLDVDPATKVTRDPDDNNTYYYEPWSLYVTLDDPAVSDERLKGVRYCKLLSHQAILSWMLEKSFEENPVLITPASTECNGPSALESPTNGSCLLYFELAASYYCSDFTGSGFTPENSKAKCETSVTYTNPVYSSLPCSQRTAEIEAYIPAGYLGLTGICVVHCQATNEFIWNIYTANPEASCGGFDFFTPEELGK
jgi:hypothetical protein